MDTVLVYVETSDGDVRKAVLEVLSACRRFADQRGLSVSALLIRSAGERIPEAVAALGPDQIVVVEGLHPGALVAETMVSVMASAIEQARPVLTVFAASEHVNHFLGALAVRVGGRVVPDVQTFDVEDGVLRAVRPVMSGNRLARVEARGERLLLSVLPGYHEITRRPSQPEIVELRWEDRRDAAVQFLDTWIENVRGGQKLGEANVVVAAGRGVKDEAGRALIYELADAFDGAVGCSRAVVESGLFPASAQVGQTGKVVSPELYFAIGISGAVQHVAGMRGSRFVVAVNRDREAPIFEYASFGLVGDLYEILPALIAEVRRRKQSVPGPTVSR